MHCGRDADDYESIYKNSKIDFLNVNWQCNVDGTQEVELVIGKQFFSVGKRKPSCPYKLWGCATNLLESFKIVNRVWSEKIRDSIFRPYRPAVVSPLDPQVDISEWVSRHQLKLNLDKIKLMFLQGKAYLHWHLGWQFSHSCQAWP